MDIDNRTAAAAMMAKNLLDLLWDRKRDLWLGADAVRDLKRLAREAPEQINNHE